MTEFDPMAVNGSNEAPIESADKEQVFAAIKTLYEEAKNWADGEPVANQKQHDAVTKIKDTIHELGKRAEELRVAEKKPLDDKVAEIQAEYNPYTQKGKGMVDRAKKGLEGILSAFRIAEIKKREAEAEEKRRAAEKLREEAQAEIRATAGNIAAREEAEQKLEESKRAERDARRSERAATQGTGLRTVKTIHLTDVMDAMEWAFDHDPERIKRVAIDMASEYFRATTKVAPGFEMKEEQVAR